MNESRATSARLNLQWLLGDWAGMAAVRPDDAVAHPAHRDLLIQSAIAGCLQTGRHDELAEWVRRALDAGWSRADLGRLMVAGVHNTLGRASAAIGDSERSMQQFRLAISTAPGGVDSAELAAARAGHQLELMAAETVDEKLADQDSAPPAFRKPDSGIMSYAQNFEDVMLWRALGRIERGFYIDVGAQDPVVDSVSRAFYEKGWRGIHVEPTQAYADMLRLDRPDEEVVQAAISATEGEIVFYEIPETGISTGDPEIAAGHVARGFNTRQIHVPCLSLAQILGKAGDRDIHWLKIDVEGMEEAVLRSWGDAPQRPWIVVVESTLPLTETMSHAAWDHLLVEKNYTHVYFDGLNRFYLSAQRPELAAAFDSSPNVFDAFVLSGKASATFCRAGNN